MKSGPIVLIEDDEDDKMIIEDVLEELSVTNKLLWFDKAKDAFQYLLTTDEQPFIILSDVNLPGRTGVELKSQIDSNNELRRKSIPFIFYSTTIDQETVNTVYIEMTVQGYFQKKHQYHQVKDTIKLIIDYWKLCQHPNSESEETPIHTKT